MEPAEREVIQNHLHNLCSAVIPEGPCSTVSLALLNDGKQHIFSETNEPDCCNIGSMTSTMPMVDDDVCVKLERVECEEFEDNLYYNNQAKHVDSNPTDIVKKENESQDQQLRSCSSTSLLRISDTSNDEVSENRDDHVIANPPLCNLPHTRHGEHGKNSDNAIDDYEPTDVENQISSPGLSADSNASVDAWSDNHVILDLPFGSSTMLAVQTVVCCPLCPAQFASFQMLEEHCCETHSGLRRFHCCLCLKQCFIGHLRKNVKPHGDEYVHVCATCDVQSVLMVKRCLSMQSNDAPRQNKGRTICMI